MRRFTALVALIGSLAVLSGLSTSVGTAQAATASMVSCPTDFPGTLKYHYYSASGTETTAAGQYSVHAAVVVRDPEHCSGLIDQAQGALRGYDDGNPAVGNVQVADPVLWADCGAAPPCLRASSNMTSNSNGAAYTAIVYTPAICVSPFGSGAYDANGHFTWRTTDGVLHSVFPYSNWTSFNYATVAC